MTTPSEYRNQGTHEPRGDASGAPDHDGVAGEARADEQPALERPTGLGAFVRGLFRPHDHN
jgi:hypothetical protein